MKKLTVGLLLLIGCVQYCIAQSASIKGTVIDTSEKKNLSNAVVAILRKSDSILVKFTRTDKDGNFILNKLPQGQFFMLVTHPNYADYFDAADLDGKSEITLKTVPMITKAQLLEEVIVKQQLGAIRMKKDTTEFIADSFKLAPNATVEDLLRRLPGFQVDKDGKITAQGESVPKVLVDGEEFFGNDPTVAIQNIRADNVERVQLYDKKSDQAAFSGIDDGERTKTVNLKLKENKKNGYFGKASVGGGLPNRFQNEAMINAFKGKRKIAAFGTMANTGKTGLNWQDNNNYSSGSEMIEMDDGIGFYMSSNDDFGGGGTYYGEGLPTGWSAGLHYSNKYNEGKNSLNGAYRFNKLNTVGNGRTTSQFILPDSLYYRKELTNSQQSRLRNLVTGTYEAQIDSFTTLKVTANGSIGKTDQYNYNLSESDNEELRKVNQSERRSISTIDNQALTTTALLRKRFKKAGRTMSLNFNQTYTNRESDGFLLSDNRYYNEDLSLKSRDSINQKKDGANYALTFAGKVVLTEAITKTLFVEANYSITTSDTRSKRITLGNVNGKYEDYVDSLSTDYEFDVLTHRGGLSFRVNKKKYNISIGSDISNSSFKQNDLLRDTSLNYDFVNLFPRANFQYIMGPQRRLTLSYNGNTRQPTIDQLQPVRDNSDPLNIYRGNPNLKQEFRNTFRLNFNDYKVLTNRNIYANLSLNVVDNAIGTAESFDYTLGKRIYAPVNVDGNYNFNGYVGYGWKIKKIDLNLNFNLDGSIGKNNTVVNGEKNVNTNKRYGGGVNLYYFKQKKINLGMWSSVSRNISESSIREGVPTKYWAANFNPNATVYLPKKFELGSDATIDLREKTDLFTQDVNVVKWNAWVGKKFFKEESLMLRFEIRDILDQNIGFQRNISSRRLCVL